MPDKELLLVRRRMTALLMVSTLLLSTALPAIACKLATRQGDCCPTTAPGLCVSPEISITLKSTVADCCVLNSTSTPSLIPEVSGRESERTLLSGSPDPFMVSLRLRSSQRAAIGHSFPLDPFRAPRSDASLTWLLTARLRL